ncbi:MAG: cell division protein FtsW [Candidatus Midichloriaceae bacterium]|jgi:cell division protein FtsW
MKEADKFHQKWWNNIDIFALANILIIMLLGMLLLTSAGIGVAEKLNLPNYYFIKRQLVYLLVGLLTIFCLFFFNEKYIRRFILLGLVSTIISLVLVIFFGEAIKGSKRWLNIAHFSFQPSEFLKPFYISFLAIILSHQKKKLNFKMFSICISFNILIAILLLLQPDFGMTITNTVATFALLFIAGIKLSWVIVILLFGVLSLYSAYTILPHVALRIDKFMNPVTSSNYQVKKSLSSFLNSGFFGKGPGEGTIKYNLPDSHTDFIFAVAAEEFGLIFCLMIILAFTVFSLRGFWNLTKLNSTFNIYACFGILMYFSMQFLFNIGVTLNLFPTKGMTLPFISYGGSSILSFSIAIGIYLNLTQKKYQSKKENRKTFIFSQKK